MFKQYQNLLKLKCTITIFFKITRKLHREKLITINTKHLNFCMTYK